jgi:hypothetical protein
MAMSTTEDPPHAKVCLPRSLIDAVILSKHALRTLLPETATPPSTTAEAVALWGKDLPDAVQVWIAWRAVVGLERGVAAGEVEPTRGHPADRPEKTI